jgi:hypothetical protein
MNNWLRDNDFTLWVFAYSLMVTSFFTAGNDSVAPTYFLLGAATLIGIILVTEEYAEET